jgi:hypothetical protein
MMVMALIAIATAIGIRPMGHALDRAAVDEGAERYGAVHETARAFAIARGRQSRVELDSALRQATISLRRTSSQWDTMEVRALGGAAFTASRIIVTFSPMGIGYGASNTSIVFSAGMAAETLTVSRTGRLKRN